VLKNKADCAVSVAHMKSAVLPLSCIVQHCSLEWRNWHRGDTAGEIISTV